jgi:hypothetical protein
LKGEACEEDLLDANASRIGCAEEHGSFEGVLQVEESEDNAELGLVG